MSETWGNLPIPRGIPKTMPMGNRAIFPLTEAFPNSCPWEIGQFSYSPSHSKVHAHGKQTSYPSILIQHAWLIGLFSMSTLCYKKNFAMDLLVNFKTHLFL